MSEVLGGVAVARLRAYRAEQKSIYAAARPQSAALARQATALVGGVPMQWMTDWPLPFALSIDHAEGASLTEVDGHRYADFCLGDTGAMFGHAPPAVVAAVTEQARRGFTHMLPTRDAPVVGRLLADIFGLPEWQIALTATDANRFALRVARAITGRPRILVFNGCYHGTVDETFVHLADGVAETRPGLLGQFIDLTGGAAVVEFNDLPARYQAALANKPPGHSGIGTTLGGNALSLAALRATLEHVLTRENYAAMEARAARLADALAAIIAEAAAAHLVEIEQALHIGLRNQSVLIAPFHNMMLVSPATSDADCAAMAAATRKVVVALTG